MDGFDHVVQSIGVILTTPKATRVMRREFGSDVPALLDRPLNAATVVDVMVAAADAIDRWEPRFRVESIDVAGGPDGRLDIAVNGTYFPRGHLGDFTRASEARAEVSL
ncbi:GPW/gp25 family protein [Kaustia mangrovi]|uniref:GPW/gp25 family protein n=1 Tax=Kaustia mangrovi TaxID=2593653 RepID=A0A7S8HE74_9HYPH|nr:GPW/gp25 family protein [Kaustia mangrovi]QPC45421.1 GPW/gp25 family protein [Kaustia mangrovi]